MNKQIVEQTVTPLRLIFWGGLLCIFDFNFSQATNGRGFQFDVLNDALGMILITVAVFRLSRLVVHDRYATVMKFVQIVSVLALLDALRKHVVMPLPPVAYFAFNLFGIVTVAAAVAFCVAMRWFCEEADLPGPARSWSVTTLLFAALNVIPLGLLYVMAASAVASGTSFNFDLGPFGALLLPVFVIPLVHLFVSTSRMTRAAEAVASVE